MFCRRCGKEIEDDAAFCSYCGIPVIIVDQEDTSSNTFTSTSTSTNVNMSTVTNEDKASAPVTNETPEVVSITTKEKNDRTFDAIQIGKDVLDKGKLNGIWGGMIIACIVVGFIGFVTRIAFVDISTFVMAIAMLVGVSNFDSLIPATGNRKHFNILLPFILGISYFIGASFTFRSVSGNYFLGDFIFWIILIFVLCLPTVICYLLLFTHGAKANAVSNYDEGNLKEAAEFKALAAYLYGLIIRISTVAVIILVVYPIFDMIFG